MITDDHFFESTSMIPCCIYKHAEIKFIFILKVFSQLRTRTRTKEVEDEV